MDDVSFLKMCVRIRDGIRMQPNTRGYRYAMAQVVRLWAPASGLLFATMFAVALSFVSFDQELKDTVPVIIAIEPEKQELIEEIKEIRREEIFDFDRIVKDLAEGALAPVDENPIPGLPGASRFSPRPAELDSVPVMKSVITMKGIYSNRNPAARGEALREYGGNSATEAAVMRALRWLKKAQRDNGSWGTYPPAMTALAILAFLAHGETPSSEEFGQCVEAAMKWLIYQQTAEGRFRGADTGEYCLPIAAYSLSEAYGVTHINDLKYAAEKSIALIIEGQHASGGWNYNLDNKDRDDTSYMGWCVQALKAAKMARLDCPGLDRACNKAIAGFRKNFAGDGHLGGFGYDKPEMSGLTPVGVLCLQLLGASKSDEVTGGLAFMATDRFMAENRDSTVVWHQGLYYWYYVTQAKFHTGNEAWTMWNNLFSLELIGKQHVIGRNQSEYLDHKGIPQETGFWDLYKGAGSGGVGWVSEQPGIFGTLLCCLQLEVYYRYLPTYKALADDIETDAIAVQSEKLETAPNGVNIDITF